MIQKICDSLQGKKEHFLHYKAATEALLSCEIDDMEHYIIKRQELANNIDEISNSLRELCAQSEHEAILREAMVNACDYDALSNEQQSVFLAAQEVLGVINEISVHEGAVHARMETLQKELREHLAQFQLGPKIARYRSGLQEGDGFSFLGNRYDKV